MLVDRIEQTYYVSASIDTVDEEEKMIMRRLYYVYGVRPTGNKATDKAKLHQCEMQQFQTERIVSTKYLTLSKNEQEEKLKKWKQDKMQTVQNDPEELKRLGAKLKGEQVYFAIQMKKQIEKSTEQKRKAKQEEQDKKNINKKYLGF